MRISDWSSDVCSSDLGEEHAEGDRLPRQPQADADLGQGGRAHPEAGAGGRRAAEAVDRVRDRRAGAGGRRPLHLVQRSEEHTSELQSLMRISYAVFCLKKKTHSTQNNNYSWTQTNISTVPKSSCSK